LEYTVSLDLLELNDTPYAVDSVKGMSGAKISEPEELDYGGSAFAGWYMDGAIWNFETDVVEGEMTLVAKWVRNAKANYTIYYYEMDLDGNYPDTAASSLTEEGYVGDKVIAPGKTGFSMDSTQEGHASQGMIGEDGLILNVYLSRNKYRYTINYNDNGATSSVSSEVYYGAVLTEPEAVDRPGYQLKGWSGLVDQMPASEITVTAQWQGLNYTVEFDANITGLGDVTDADLTGTMEVQSFVYGGNDALNVNAFALNGTGYAFNGWNTKADGSGTYINNQQSEPFLPQEENEIFTLYAQWIKGETIEYTVAYMVMEYKQVGYMVSAGEVPMTGVVGAYIQIDALQDTDLINGLEDHGIDDWNPQHFYVEKPNVILKASDAGNKFEVRYYRNMYSAILDPNGGTFKSGTSIGDQTLTADTSKSVVFGTGIYNSEVKLTNVLNVVPVREGYVFNGWQGRYYTYAGTEENWYADGYNYVIMEGDQTLTAEWKRESVKLEYYDDINQKVLGTVSAQPGEAITPPEVSRDETGRYTFVEWSENYTHMPEEGGKVYAVWEPTKFKVYFEPNLPAGVDESSLKGEMPEYADGFVHFTDKALPENQWDLSDAGYVFTGWEIYYSANDPRNEIIEDGALIGDKIYPMSYSGDMYLMAQWEVGTPVQISIRVHEMTSDGSGYELLRTFSEEALLGGTFQWDVPWDHSAFYPSAKWDKDSIQTTFKVTEENQIFDVYVDLKQVTLTYDFNGGVLDETQAHTEAGTYYYNTKVVFPVLKKDGYELLYWKDANGNPIRVNDANFAGYWLTKNNTLTAVWKEITPEAEE